MQQQDRHTGSRQITRALFCIIGCGLPLEGIVRFRVGLPTSDTLIKKKKNPHRHAQQNSQPRLTTSNTKYREQKWYVESGKREAQVTSDSTTKSLKVSRAWNALFKAMEEDNNCQPRLLYPAKLPVTLRGKIRSFHDKNRPKEFMTTKPVLRRTLERTL